MKFSIIKKGDRLYDRWWPWVSLYVTKKLKTRVKVMDLSSGVIMTYDSAHCQFLEKRKK